MHMYARPLTGLCSAHQDIIPVLVAPLGKAGIEARQVDAMARAQGIEYIIWQAALVVEVEVAFQDGRGIHKPGGQATSLEHCVAQLAHGGPWPEHVEDVLLAAAPEIFHAAQLRHVPRHRKIPPPRCSIDNHSDRNLKGLAVGHGLVRCTYEHQAAWVDGVWPPHSAVRIMRHALDADERIGWQVRGYQLQGTVVQ